jgi:hypothetical protein
MNNRQLIALKNPCRFASQIKNKIYSQNITISQNTVSTILTVDYFCCAAFWHVSARIIKNDLPLNIFAKIGRIEAKQIADYLKGPLEKVGRGNIRQNNSITQFNYFKMLAENEMIF